MSKYIDVNELHNQGWVAARYINWEPTPFNDNFRLEVEVKPFITFPAADVGEVNRCKTCYHYKPREYGYNCTVLDWDVNEDDFCSRWETKDE